MAVAELKSERTCRFVTTFGFSRTPPLCPVHIVSVAEANRDTVLIQVVHAFRSMTLFPTTVTELQHGTASWFDHETCFTNHIASYSALDCWAVRGSGITEEALHVSSGILSHWKWQCDHATQGFVGVSLSFSLRMDLGLVLLMAFTVMWRR